MRTLSRVVWSEGMHLGPHHFQAQNRYFEDSIQFATSALSLAGYGLSAGELNLDAVTNGAISLIHARGIFPDGLVFNMPECDPLPAPRNIANVFPPTSDKLTILLGVPTAKQDGLNCVLSETESNGRARYTAESHPLPDDNTGRDEKP